MGSDSVTQEAFPTRKPQRLVPYSENKGYASNPRRFLDLFNFDSDLQTFTTPISLKIGMK